MTTILTDIVQALKAAQTFLVVSHIFPDFDTMAASLALKLALEKEGKSVTVYNDHGLPPNMKFLPGSEAVVSALEPGASFDVTLLVDSGVAERYGKVLLGDRSHLGRLIKIDHHLTSETISDLEYNDHTSASTGELVCDILKAYPIEIDRNIALNIYVAIVSDTGGFRYSNTNQRAFNTAAEMMSYGLDAWDVTTQLYENRPAAEMRLLAETLNTLDISSDGRFASLTVSNEAMQRTGAQEHMTDGFVNFARSLEGVEVAILLSERPEGGKYRISFRSKGLVNVATIAESLGGGGHHNAAGCTLSGDLNDVKKKLYGVVTKKLTNTQMRQAI
jgi:phosphoesterase RecJ-like protein